MLEMNKCELANSYRHVASVLSKINRRKNKYPLVPFFGENTVFLTPYSIHLQSSGRIKLSEEVYSEIS